MLWWPPARKITSSILHVGNFATVISHSVNIWSAGYLICDPSEEAMTHRLSTVDLTAPPPNRFATIVGTLLIQITLASRVLGPSYPPGVECGPGWLEWGRKRFAGVGVVDAAAVSRDSGTTRCSSPAPYLQWGEAEQALLTDAVGEWPLCFPREHQS